MSKKITTTREKAAFFNSDKQLDICSDEGQSGLGGAYLKELAEVDRNINQAIEELKKQSDQNTLLKERLNALNIRKNSLKQGYEKLQALQEAQEEFEKSWILKIK